jgi:hypothetical protein
VACAQQSLLNRPDIVQPLVEAHHDALAASAYAANLGGKIRHPEIVEGTTEISAEARRMFQPVWFMTAAVNPQVSPGGRLDGAAR